MTALLLRRLGHPVVLRRFAEADYDRDRRSFKPITAPLELAPGYHVYHHRGLSGGGGGNATDHPHGGKAKNYFDGVSPHLTVTTVFAPQGRPLNSIRSF